jgi:hypothetical protein
MSLLPKALGRRGPRAVIIAVTGTSLFLSFVISALWLASVPGTGKFEPAVGALGLLAGITGIVAERRAATIERRDQALSSVRAELLRNKQRLDSPPPAARRQIYLRLFTSAVDDTLSSAVLPVGDIELRQALDAWHDIAHDFNQRLTLAELISFLGQDDRFALDVHHALYGVGGEIESVQQELDKVLALLPADA